MTAGAGPMYVGRNILLQRLSGPDLALLAPHAAEVSVAAGTRLHHPDQPLEAVYFPNNATVSLQDQLPGGDSVEIAIIGREGMIGWPAMLGSQSSPHVALVRARQGTLLRVPVQPLRAACQRSPTLQEALLQFIHVMMVQMARSIASHLQHALNRRVARWLLMRHDRLGGDVLLCQHDEIARCLAVRRASVTDQLHLIEGERLIRCTRGRVVVRDRGGLEHYAGDAYGHAEHHYRRLIAPFGKSIAAAALQ